MQNHMVSCAQFISRAWWARETHRFTVSTHMVKFFFCSLLLLGSASVAVRAQGQWPEYSKLDSTYATVDSTVAGLHNEIRNDSTKLDSFRKLLDIYKQQGEFEKELVVATAMAQANPYAPRAYYALGDAQLDNGMMEEALASLHKALSLEPRYVRALTMLAEAYDLLRLQDTALVYLDSAIHCNSRSVQAYFQKAELLTRMGRRVEAIESYRSWANLQPHIAEPWVKLGEAQSIIGEYEDAIITLNYALSLSPDWPEALFQLAVAKQGTGKTVEARNAFRDFFFRFPQHARAQEAEELARALGWKPGEN